MSRKKQENKKTRKRENEKTRKSQISIAAFLWMMVVIMRA